MKYVMSLSTEQYDLESVGLSAFIRQRNEAGVNRLHVSIYEFGVDCPELVLISRKITNDRITGEQLSEAYAKLSDEEKCKQEWDKFKRRKVKKV